MKLKLKTTFYFLLCTCLLNAEEKQVTLDECVDIAMQNHPDLFISIEDNKKSINDYKITKSEKSILVNGQIATRQGNVNTDNKEILNFPGTDYSIALFAGLVFSYKLYDNTTDINIEMSRTNIDISKIRSLDVKNKIVLGVKNSYYNYLLAKENLVIREEMYNKYKDKTLLSRRLFEEGLRPILDVSRAELDLADAQLQFEKANEAENTAKLYLYYSMGLELTNNNQIFLENVNAIPQLTCSFDDLIKLAEIYNTSIRMLILHKKIARLRIDSIEARHYPNVDITGSLGYIDNSIYKKGYFDKNFESDNWVPAFGVTFNAALPVYSGGRISAATDSAVSDYNKILYQEKKAVIELKNQVRSSMQSLEETKKQMKIYDLLVSNAQRNLLLAQKSYENGAGTMLELQDAELSVIRAKTGYIQSKYTYLITLAKLVDIIGTGESSICKCQD